MQVIVGSSVDMCHARSTTNGYTRDAVHPDNGLTDSHLTAVHRELFRTFRGRPLRRTVLPRGGLPPYGLLT